MEAGVGRAARVAADDKAAAEQRIASRKRLWRQGVLAVLLVPLLLVAGTVLVDRVFFGPPSLAVGTRHAVTMRMGEDFERCGLNPSVWSSADYGGVWWEPLAFFPASWGTTGPWKGELTITAPVKRHLLYQEGPGPEVANGTFTYRGVTIPVAGPGYRSMGPIC